jgi:hypothetical protein
MNNFREAGRTFSENGRSLQIERPLLDGILDPSSKLLSRNGERIAPT